MFERIRPQLTYANVMASLAMFMVLGGGAYAAVTLPKNSVGTAQLKRGAVTASKIKANAVSSAKVANGSLLAQDFRAGQLPQGPQGAQGPTGPQGAQGPKGDTGAAGADGADFTATTTLASGQTLTGSWGVGGGASDWLSDSVQFRIPLAASISNANTHYMDDGFTPTTECPGPQQAAAGHLCVYEMENTNDPALSSIYHHEQSSGSSQAGAGRSGFLIYFVGTAANTYVSGNWAVTAP